MYIFQTRRVPERNLTSQRCRIVLFKHFISTTRLGTKNEKQAKIEETNQPGTKSLLRLFLIVYFVFCFCLVLSFLATAESLADAHDWLFTWVVAILQACLLFFGGRSKAFLWFLILQWWFFVVLMVVWVVLESFSSSSNLPWLLCFGALKILLV